MIDRSRGQLIGEELVNGMKAGYPTQAQDQSVMMMRFTRSDMYVRHKNWQFAFAHPENGRFAVISTTRMDPVSFGFSPNDGVLVRRLLKMCDPFSTTCVLKRRVPGDVLTLDRSVRDDRSL